MTDQTSIIRKLHTTYCSLTRLSVPLSMNRIYIWELFVARGYTESELCLVIVHIQGRIRQDRRRPESLKFSKLILDIDRFEEDLAEARANRQQSSRVIREPVIREPVSATQSLERLKLAQMLAEWRRTNL